MRTAFFQDQWFTPNSHYAWHSIHHILFRNAWTWSQNTEDNKQKNHDLETQYKNPVLFSSSFVSINILEAKGLFHFPNCKCRFQFYHSYKVFHDIIAYDTWKISPIQCLQNFKTNISQTNSIFALPQYITSLPEIQWRYDGILILATAIQKKTNTVF